MENKTEDLYYLIWTKIRELTTLTATTALCDFEKASLNAFQRVYPSINLTCCFFHLSQCIWRSIQRNGIVTHYNNDDNIRNRLKMFGALAFCPVNDVVRYFEIIEDVLREEGSCEILNEFIMYFEDTFIGRFTRQGRVQPRFGISLWNQRDRTINDLPRTNNHIEGWHRAFSSMISCNHPNIFTFLLFLKKEQSLSDNKIDGAILNSANNHRNTRYEIISSQLKATIENYHQLPPLEFLKNIAYTYNF
ncbi:hypothetical protein RF11_10389 [Thelohanellus kitauei]|uniref:MULE transposase domain-containing protein n=1 Tax=Thelohanellus kitauei TaxID=669202 RepID=A0A0C2NF77_THEKT|nr:hypothetical protein RF11_10389 [Thelohanellus kitauei]